MPEVNNWQIGRKMMYPYPEEEQRPERQFAIVLDLNKCIACQTCTIICKQTWSWGKGQEYMLWNNVETKPYGFHPLGWDVRILDLLGPARWENGRYAGKTIFEAAPTGEVALGWLPESEDWAYPNLGEDEPQMAVKQGIYIPGLPHTHWMFYLPRLCNHCTYPACLAACPRKAIYKRKEDGIVLVDQTRCRGYQECIRACPYKKVVFNNFTRVTEKCIGCYPPGEQGRQSQCSIGCIGRIRLTGYLSKPDKVDERNPLDFLVKVRKVALPLYPLLGTEPNMYYLPPINVPLSFLKQMFGPGAEAAVKTYMNAKNDPELLGLLMLFGSTPRKIATFKAEKDKAFGYDEKGQEIVSVPIREPTYILPFYEEKWDAYRHNIT